MIIKKLSYFITFKIIALVIITSNLIGCNSIDQAMSMVVPFYSYDKTPLSNISISASHNSNQNMPVAVDIVFIYKDTVNAALLGLSGPEWFKNKPELLLRYKKDLEVVHKEIVPRTLTETIELPEHYDDAIKILIFANYLAPSGQYIADITKFSDLHIELNKSSYQLKEMEP